MKRSEIFFNVILLPLDYIAIIGAAIAAYFLRFTSLAEVVPVVYELPFIEFLNISLLVGLAMLIVFAINKMYVMKGTRRIIDEFGKVFVSCSAGIMVIIVAIFLQRELFSSRFIILAAWILAVIFVFMLRLFVILVQRSLFKKGIGVKRAVLIGSDKTKQELSDTFRKRKVFGIKVVGEYSMFDENAEGKILELWRGRNIDEVILADPTLNKETNLKLADFTQEHNLTFKYAADLFKTYATNIDVSTISGIPVVELKRTPLDGWGRVIKRLLDIIFSLLVIIVLSPIYIVTAIAIKIDSNGPILFSRKDDKSKVRRIGQAGEPFWYFKFRSMKPETDGMRTSGELSNTDLRDDSPLTKFKDDPRITKVGKILRKFSIDELPEFFLVLGGKMSLVGPRPHLPEEVANYKKHHKRVLDIKPGITGMAQVSGRSDLDFEEEIKLDVYYIENWSIKSDLQILFKTPFILLKKRQAL